MEDEVTEIQKVVDEIHNPEEQWKDVAGFEGRYQVSNMGHVRSIRNGKFRLLKPAVHERGHLGVQLFGKGFDKKIMLGKMVATAFIANPLNKNRVNHINGDLADNRADNLEWATQKEIVLLHPHAGYRGKHSEEWNRKIALSHVGLMKGMKWWNDGIKSVRSIECPDGFKPGRIFSKK